MMGIHIIQDAMTRAQLQEIAEECYGDLVKGVVDLKRGVIALGPEMHADAEADLIAQGSLREDVWGINLYPAESGEGFLEFDSMINIKPTLGNRSRGVEDAGTRAKITALVEKLIK